MALRIRLLVSKTQMRVMQAITCQVLPSPRQYHHLGSAGIQRVKRTLRQRQCLGDRLQLGRLRCVAGSPGVSRLKAPQQTQGQQGQRQHLAPADLMR